MEFDLSQLQNLLTTLNQTDISELTLRVEDFELIVRRQNFVASGYGVEAVENAAPAVEPPAPVVVAAAPPPPPAKSTSAPLPPPGKRENVTEIVSPMVGTFYSAPAPGELPFVSVGDSVKPGQTVCIIEAMKLMNELEAEVSGQILEILVENGQPVEFNQPLMRIAK
ncbi:MAG: acetyl-CoA carboxylase biotin carboxyl carrier protein [Prochlorotrichaceae cyanobacterium]